MQINLAKSAGFCFGVKRAISIAYKALDEKNKIYMLGDIVHNEDVCQQLSKDGIMKVKQLNKNKNKNSTLLVRAHGAPKKTFKMATGFGYKIIDATCTMVKEIHNISIEAEKKWL